MLTMLKRLLSVTVLAALTACGGGGGSGTVTPTVSTSSFPLKAAYSNYITSTQSLPFTLTGIEEGIKFSGSGRVTVGGIAAATFEGSPALSKTLTGTGSITVEGTTVPWSNSGTDYFDSNYNPLGSYYDSYEVVTSLTPIPVAAKVGDAGTWYTFDIYSSPTNKLFKTGTGTVSYVLEPDTATTALLKIIEIRRNSSSKIDSTTVTFRITEGGTITRISEQTLDDTTSITVNY